jgi:arylsulfatase A-like enzyme
MPTAEELAQLDDRTKTNLIAKYDGSLRYADEQIGHLLEHLRTSGTLANTAVAVSTDHGLELVDRYSATHGHNPFDEVVRTFLILFDQSTTFGGVAPEQMQARILDIGTTLMALAHVEKPPTAEGVDLLSRDAVVPEYAFARCYNADVVRTLSYKLIDVDFSLARRKGDHLPVGLQEGRHLFALRTDPAERHDVAAENPRIAEAMQRARDVYGPVRQCADETSQRPMMDSAIQERLRLLGYQE